MSSAILLGRPPERSSSIVRELRGRITRGDLAPGTQLPTRVEIGQHFSASSETVQRALEELRRDGFITVKGRQGTFVSFEPPHLKNYALVFSTPQGHWNRFFAALNYEAPLAARATGRRISVYYGADSHSQHEDYHRLLADVKAHRLGGIIFTSVPSLVVGTAILDEPNIPRVGIMSPAAEFTMPHICTDGPSFWERSADELLARQRRNVALLLPPLGASEIEKITRRLKERGLFVPSKWVQVVPRNCLEAAQNLTELLFDEGRQRPDALVVADDNPVEYALAGLVTAGVKVPDEVEVITHCNFPHPVPSVLPVRRLGFDSRRVLQACFDKLDSLKAGEDVPSLTLVPAQFEEEIAVD